MVDGSRNDWIPDSVLETAAHTLRVLTHPQRLKICERLLEGRRAVGDLAAELGLKQNVVSQHLNHLRAHGIVAPERDGRAVYYQVVHRGPQWLLACIRTHMTAAATDEAVTAAPVGDGAAEPAD